MIGRTVTSAAVMGLDVASAMDVSSAQTVVVADRRC
jgi:hypothetical protein